MADPYPTIAAKSETEKCKLTDRFLLSLKPAAPGKRRTIWDEVERGLAKCLGRCPARCRDRSARLRPLDYHRAVTKERCELSSTFARRSRADGNKVVGVRHHAFIAS